MTSAIKQSSLLQDSLEATEPDRIAAAQAVFMRDIPSVVQAPWTMASSVDLAFPEARGERPEHFEQHRRFEAAIARAAVADPDVHRALMRAASQVTDAVQRISHQKVHRTVCGRSRDLMKGESR
jgi:hypothetical protein